MVGDQLTGVRGVSEDDSYQEWWGYVIWISYSFNAAKAIHENHETPLTNKAFLPLRVFSWIIFRI
jgi:hypothetical protein